MTHDPIANMLACIRNASLRKAKIVEIPATRTTRSLATILLKEQFISNLRERQTQHQSVLVLALKYNGRHSQSSITAIKQISKPGLRVYAKTQDIPRILGGIGVVIISTPQGIMTDRSARRFNVGGELLCSIW